MRKFAWPKRNSTPTGSQLHKKQLKAQMLKMAIEKFFIDFNKFNYRYQTKRKWLSLLYQAI
jgi:hypothetical protein